MFSSSYPYMPIWLLGLLFLALMLLARELGHRVRGTQAAQGERKDDAFAMTSVLGLLALLIGFTFSISLSRYESRRELVVKEANAIGTTWLRMQLLDEAPRARMQSLLRAYVDSRIAFGQARDGAEESQRQHSSEALQGQLWTGLMASVAPFRDTPRASLLVTTMNESIDLAAERYAERQAHIPGRILRMLCLFAFLAAALVGYERGSERRTTTLLFVLLTLAITLVIDLDLPSTGATQVPQQPMLDLRASMQPGSGG